MAPKNVLGSVPLTHQSQTRAKPEQKEWACMLGLVEARRFCFVLRRHPTVLVRCTAMFCCGSQPDSWSSLLLINNY